jgi:hypothetical protein
VKRTVVVWQAQTKIELISPISPRGTGGRKGLHYIYSYYCFCPTIITGAKRSSKGIGMRITTQTYYFAIRVDDLKSYEDKPVELA